MYNDYIDYFTLMTLFWLNYNYYSMMQLNRPKAGSIKSHLRKDYWIAGMEESDPHQQQP